MSPPCSLCLSILLSLVFLLPDMECASHSCVRVAVVRGEQGNLYFLYTLLLSESDFHTLKREQNILVDFSNFSSNLIHLWEQCWQHRDEQQPK